MSTGRWSGRVVQQARAIVSTWLPTQCGQCGETVNTTDAWVVGHKLARALHPELTLVPSNWQAEHRSCSDRSGQSVVIEKAKRDALIVAGVDFPLSQRPAEPPHLPESLPEVRSELEWANHARNAPQWLRELLNVPEDSSVPLAMTPVHPEAVGSYGAEAIAFIESAFRVSLRWWQKLVLVRMLEHRDDGTLCWREVLQSASRRSGKSLLLRGLAVWRMSRADLFGETQTVLHVASDVAIAREVQRFAWTYAETVGWRISRANGKEAIESVDGDRWLVRAQNATVGYDGTLVLGDEVWDVPPAVVDDNLEPAMLDRLDPQMLLTSTAHPRARSTMPSRIATALAADDSSTLLLLWAAPWGCDVADPEQWRRASPHWSEDRRKRMESAYAKAVAGESEVDNIDPLAAFRSQYLNQWNLSPRRREIGNVVVSEEAWAKLTDDVPGDLPSSAAIESHYDQGASLALCWRGETTLVSVTDHTDLADAVEALKLSGFRGRTIVGASLMSDPALRTTPKRAGQGRAASAVTDLGRLLSENAVHHDGGEHLSEQVLGVRTMPGTDGPRIVSKGRADAIKAAVWAIEASRATGSVAARIVLPSSVSA